MRGVRMIAPECDADDVYFYPRLTRMHLLDKHPSAYQETCMPIDDRQNTAPTLQKGSEPAAHSPSVQANSPSGSQGIGPKRMLLVFAMVIILPCVGLAIAVEILAALVHGFSH
jgi:hypothetical protein